MELPAGRSGSTDQGARPRRWRAAAFMASGVLASTSRRISAMSCGVGFQPSGLPLWVAFAEAPAKGSGFGFVGFAFKRIFAGGLSQ